jgi:hypothetical protein
VLQRNPHPYALDVPAIPATVQPGDTVDWHQYIAGFEPVPDGPDGTLIAAEAPPEPAAKTTIKRAAASADTSKE